MQHCSCRPCRTFKGVVQSKCLIPKNHKDVDIWVVFLSKGVINRGLLNITTRFVMAMQAKSSICNVDGHIQTLHYQTPQDGGLFSITTVLFIIVFRCYCHLMLYYDQHI